MPRGVSSFLGVVAVLGVGGCVANRGTLEIRATGKSMAADVPSNLSLHEANAQLSLGNAGLALELFRKALREQPESKEAHAGIAASYDKMGRFDLAQRYYESALARAPDDTGLLERLAASLTRQGKTLEAGAIRDEIRLRLGLRSAAAAESSTVLPAGRAMGPANDASTPTASVTISLPPAEPIETSAAAAAAADVAGGDSHGQDHEGPSLERLSPVEVVLVTTPKRLWKSQVVAQTEQSTTLRFVPLKVQPEVAGIRLLNAARAQGLATRTRDYLTQRGWRRLAIGDADQVRETSVIYYPAARIRTARALAAQFGIPVAQQSRGSRIVMLLGRDAARLRLRGSSG